MNNIKITPKNTTTDVGSLCINLIVSNLLDANTPELAKLYIDMFMDVTNDGRWDLSRTKINRMDLVLTSIMTNDNLNLVEGLIREFNKFLANNIANSELVPKSIIVEIDYADIKFTKSFLSLLLDSAIPVYISIVDPYCNLPIETLEYITGELGMLKNNKIYYTLLVDDTIDVLSFEKYQVDKEYYLKWFERKACVVYELSENMNLIKFAFDYHFRYFYPTTISHDTIGARTRRIEASLSSITNHLQELSKLLILE